MAFPWLLLSLKLPKLQRTVVVGEHLAKRVICLAEKPAFSLQECIIEKDTNVRM